MEKPLLKTILLKGEAGDSIESLTKVSQVGAVATYRITLTSGSIFEFQVTNGTNISTIEKTSTSGLVDTYTITLTDGSTTTFEVTNGRDGELTNIDNELDESSNNPIANRPVATAINALNGDISDIQGDIGDIQEELAFLNDNVITDYKAPITISSNPVLSGNVTQNMTQLAAGTYLVFYRFNLFDITPNHNKASIRFKFGGTATSGSNNTSAGLRELASQQFDYEYTQGFTPPPRTCTFSTAVLLDISEATTPQMSIDYDVLSSDTSFTYEANIYMTAIKIR